MFSTLRSVHLGVACPVDPHALSVIEVVENFAYSSSALPDSRRHSRHKGMTLISSPSSGAFWPPQSSGFSLGRPQLLLQLLILPLSCAQLLVRCRQAASELGVRQL